MINLRFPYCCYPFKDYLRCRPRRFIVTCGSDGDVRVWESLDDDDPKSINVGEKAFSVALRVSSVMLTSMTVTQKNESQRSTASIYNPRSSLNKKNIKMVLDLMMVCVCV